MAVDEFQRLRVSAALRATRLKPKMRRAARLVLLEGKTNAQAARAVGGIRQHVYRAMLSVRVRLAEVDRYIAESTASPHV